MFWLQGRLGNLSLEGVLDTGGTLTIVSLKAAQHQGVPIIKDYPDVTVHVGDGRWRNFHRAGGVGGAPLAPPGGKGGKGAKGASRGVGSGKGGQKAPVRVAVGGYPGPKTSTLLGGGHKRGSFQGGDAGGGP